MAEENKKTTTTKTSTPKSTTKKQTSSNKKTSTTTTKKPSTQKPKTASKSVKTDKKPSNLSSKEVKTTKKPSSRKPKPKNEGRVKKQEELTTLEVLEQAVEHVDIKEKQPLGKTFYLIVFVLSYAVAFYYAYNVFYDNSDLIQSAIFALAAVFVLFVLMLFNVHKLVMNFFVLPFKRLFKESQKEIHKEIVFSVGKNKVQTTFNKYRSVFTLILYAVLASLILYASISSSMMTEDPIMKLIIDAAMTLFLFLVVVCSWQYLFNIIPSILDKSLDARNGFVLSLSAIVIVIYIVFLILDIYVIPEIMIFILIIGFVALLGVNLNMIIGEINIFQNLRGRKSKAVTRVVFIVFFGFHVYVILYASVVAYSIYNWEPDSFVFGEPAETKQVITTDLYDFNNNAISTVYWDDDMDFNTPTVPLTTVYDINGNEITEFYDEDLNPVFSIYDQTGQSIMLRNADGNTQDWAQLEPNNTTNCPTFYNDGVFACVTSEELPHTYGDFLYWTVVTVSTIGYGDVHPSIHYNIAMGWGGFLGIYGLTFFALSISFVSNIAMEGVNSIREEHKKDD